VYLHFLYNVNYYMSHKIFYILINLICEGNKNKQGSAIFFMIKILSNFHLKNRLLYIQKTFHGNNGPNSPKLDPKIQIIIFI